MQQEFQWNEGASEPSLELPSEGVTLAQASESLLTCSYLAPVPPSAALLLLSVFATSWLGPALPRQSGALGWLISSEKN